MKEENTGRTAKSKESKRKEKAAKDNSTDVKI